MSTTKVFKFPKCGCCFPIVEDAEYTRIILNPDIRKIPLNCKATWDLIGSGNTKGVFQLESQLGQSLSKQLKPENIEHLAALTAIMRPGVLEAEYDGKSVTQHYIDRKNGLEDIEFFHPSLEPILRDTMGEMIYQESAMHIARDIAGFSLQEADVLRKAIGKKKADIMAEVKEDFLKGCAKQGIVNESQANQLFEWIEKSQRYSFNKSHAVSYAMNAYLSAYCKAHFKRSFFTSYLFYSREKQKPFDELAELISNCKSMNINVLSPSTLINNIRFKLIDKDIYFGLSDVKDIGENSALKLVKELSKFESISWMDFLIFVSQKVSKTTVQNLIKTGAFDHYDMPRLKMLHEYEQFSLISTTELKWVQNEHDKKRFKTLQQLLTAMVKAPTGRNGACYTKKRLKKVEGILQLVQSPPSSLVDSSLWVSSVEASLLGIPLTASSVDECDDSMANCTCDKFNVGDCPSKDIFLAVQIDRIKEIKTKNADDMAFLTVSDITASCGSIVVFPRVWYKYRNLLFVGNTVMLNGDMGDKKDSLIVKNIFQI